MRLIVADWNAAYGSRMIAITLHICWPPIWYGRLKRKFGIYPKYTYPQNKVYGFLEHYLTFPEQYKHPNEFFKGYEKGNIMNDRISETALDQELPDIFKREGAKEVKVVQTPSDRGEDAKEVKPE